MKISLLSAKIHLPAIILILLTVLPATAREKSDQIILKNGNSVYGEIRGMARGMLTVETDLMGTVQIKWQDVVGVNSKFPFMISEDSGDLCSGTLQAAPDPGKVIVTGRDSTCSVDHVSIVEIRELNDSLWNRLSGIIDLGFTFAKAGDHTQFNLTSQLDYTARRYGMQFSYDTMLSNSNGEEDINRKVLTLSGDRMLGKKWRALSKGKWEQNLELELDRRFSFLGGVSYDAHKSNRSLFMVAGGMSYTNEKYIDGEDNHNAEGAVGFDAQFFKLYTPKVDMVTTFYAFPNFTTAGRVRMELDTKIRLEIFSDFSVSFSFYDSYDSEPPSETATKNDYGFVSGVTWSFHR